MVLEYLPEPLAALLSGLSAGEALAVLEPLVAFVAGMIVYSIFVFRFYKFIARRDIFRLRRGGQASAFTKLAYALEYLFLFPIIAFFWFFVIAVILSMLSQVVVIDNIFMISMAIITTIRLSAYYNEDLSRDIAKLIPFALLAVFLLDISSLSVYAPVDVLYRLPAIANTLIYYFLFIVVLELLLRIIFHGKAAGEPREETKR